MRYVVAPPPPAQCSSLGWYPELTKNGLLRVKVRNKMNGNGVKINLSHTNKMTKGSLS